MFSETINILTISHFICYSPVIQLKEQVKGGRDLWSARVKLIRILEPFQATMQVPVLVIIPGYSAVIIPGSVFMCNLFTVQVLPNEMREMGADFPHIALFCTVLSQDSKFAIDLQDALPYQNENCWGASVSLCRIYEPEIGLISASLRDYQRCHTFNL